MRTNKINLKREIKILRKIIAMKCVDCVCCQPKEILRCEIKGCPLWEKRPRELRGVYSLMKELKRKNIRDYEAGN